MKRIPPAYKILYNRVKEYEARQFDLAEDLNERIILSNQIRYTVFPWDVSEETVSNLVAMRKRYRIWSGLYTAIAAGLEGVAIWSHTIGNHWISAFDHCIVAGDTTIAITDGLKAAECTKKIKLARFVLKTQEMIDERYPDPPEYQEFDFEQNKFIEDNNQNDNEDGNQA